jgi:glycosyltransferase involved in cell wall biosynthesis
MKASLIVPVLYHEPQLGDTLPALASLREELDLEILLVVDVPDPSREAEARSANDPVASSVDAVTVYRVGQRGFGSALRRAFAEAAGDVMIPMMGDASENPRDVLRLVEAVEGGLDVVSGSRYMPGGGIVGQSAKQRLSRLYSWLCRLAGGPAIHDISNAFKAYRRSVVESVRTVAESFDVSVELTLKAHLAGFRVGEVPAVWTNRRKGRSNFSIRRELRNYGRWLWLALRSGRVRARVQA